MRTVGLAMVAIGLLCVEKVKGSETNMFVSDLNTAWAAHDYTGCLTKIETRLVTNTNDVTALVAKACYYVFVNADFPAAVGVFAIADPLVASLSGTGTATAKTLYKGLRDDVVACLSVPMTEAPTESQKKYVRDSLYPTKYPEEKLLLLLGSP